MCSADNTPQIYDYNLPDGAGTPNSINALVNSITTGVPHRVNADSSVAQITSSDGTVFTSLSKDGDWGQDLYADLVAPSLQTSLLVETWIRGKRVDSSCDTYTIENIYNLTFGVRERGLWSDLSIQSGLTFFWE